MGPLLVLVSPCFRENVVVTCKIGSFWCSLDTLLQKNVIVFFFGNHISKCRSFEKGANLGLLFTFFSSPIDFFALPIVKKIRIYQVWFLFGVIPGVESNLSHFGTINK